MKVCDGYIVHSLSSHWYCCFGNQIPVFPSMVLISLCLGNRRESNTHLIKIRRDVQQRGAGGDIETDFIPGGGDREPRNLPSTVRQFIYMVAVDNKPLNALHDLKQRGKMPVNVFELTRKLYYEKLKALIDKDLKKVKGKNDEEYKKLELINLVCYDDKTEKGVFTKPILEKIDNGSMK